MGAFMTYQYKKLLRSYKFIPHLVTFIIWIVLLYVYSGQEINSSYALASIGLFVIMIWLTSTILKLESTTERQLLCLQLQSKRRYIQNKIVFALLLSMPLIIISLVYPLILSSFSYKITLVHFILALYLHVVVAILGILLSTFIFIIFNHTTKYQWLLIGLITLITILKLAMIDFYPIFKYILWIFPPLANLIDIFQSNHINIFSQSFIYINVWMIVYLVILYGLIIMIFKKKEIN